MAKQETGPFRDGKIHVLKEMCDTCIFRPGNLMHLNGGTVKSMTDACDSQEGGHIPCHKTLDGKKSICAGFWKRSSETEPIWIMATAMKIVEKVDLDD